MKRKKTIKAGRLCREVIYAPPTRWDSPKAQRERRCHSSEARKRMNDKTARGKLRLELAANFGPNDYFVTLTFRDAALPSRRKDAYMRIRGYLATLRTARHKSGEPMRYIYVIENKHGQGRFHAHIVINRTGRNDFEDIRSLWQHGDCVDIRSLREWESPNDLGYTALAEYMTKESGDRPLGCRMWCSSANLQKAIVTSEWVSDSAIISPPKGAIITEHDERKTLFGSYEFCEYYTPAAKANKRQQQKQNSPALSLVLRQGITSGRQPEETSTLY